jgi:hypothetical protein
MTKQMIARRAKRSLAVAAPRGDPGAPTRATPEKPARDQGDAGRVLTAAVVTGTVKPVWRGRRRKAGSGPDPQRSLVGAARDFREYPEAVIRQGNKIWPSGHVQLNDASVSLFLKNRLNRAFSVRM